VSDKYAHIIFDLDGTLVDSAPPILSCLKNALENEGISPVIPISHSIVGPPLRETLQLISGEKDDYILSKLVDHFKKYYDTVAFKDTKKFDGISKLLKDLSSQDVHLYIATNKRLKPTELILDYFNWSNYFDAVYASDSRSPSFSNKSEMIKVLLQDYKICSKLAIYVGDRIDDMRAAENNQIEFIAALWGYQDDGFDNSNQLKQANNPVQIKDFIVKK
jgi:phosphoglycolate phosphatase